MHCWYLRCSNMPGGQQPQKHYGITSAISLAPPREIDHQYTKKLCDAMKPFGVFEDEEELNHRWVINTSLVKVLSPRLWSCTLFFDFFNGRWNTTTDTMNTGQNKAIYYCSFLWSEPEKKDIKKVQLYLWRSWDNDWTLDYNEKVTRENECSRTKFINYSIFCVKLSFKASCFYCVSHTLAWSCVSFQTCSSWEVK